MKDGVEKGKEREIQQRCLKRKGGNVKNRANTSETYDLEMSESSLHIFC